MKPRRLHSATTLSMVTLSSGIAADRRRWAAGVHGWHSYTPSALPIYEYRCEEGHTFEVIQRMTDDPVATCEVCGASVQRVLHPVAVHFKGKGFYNTDYGTKRRARELERAGKEGSDSSSSGSSSSSDSSSSDSSTSSNSGSGSGGSGGSGGSSADTKKASKPAKSDAA